MRIETPAARSSDPITSHEAAEEVTLNGGRAAQRRTVEAAVWMHPGLTSAELARKCLLDRWQIARRLPEAELAGHVKRGEARVCGVSNRRAITWQPA